MKTLRFLQIVLMLAIPLTLVNCGGNNSSSPAAVGVWNGYQCVQSGTNTVLPTTSCPGATSGLSGCTINPSTGQYYNPTTGTICSNTGLGTSSYLGGGTTGGYQNCNGLILQFQNGQQIACGVTASCSQVRLTTGGICM